MGRLTAQLLLFGGSCAALLAPPSWGAPVVAAIAYIAWLRRCRRLLLAIAVLVVAYGLWLIVTTPV